METLQPGSYINIHRCDGSSTGGHEYLGLAVFAPRNRQRPMMLVRDDHGQQQQIAIDDIDWIDCLATPFSTGDFNQA
jgi:hypothetical protein